jgi:DNA-binding transcriptional ArsR family regulator
MQDGELHGASDLATPTGVSIGTAAYHLRELEKAGLVQFVELQPAGGSFKRLYRIA